MATFGYINLSFLANFGQFENSSFCLVANLPPDLYAVCTLLPFYSCSTNQLQPEGTCIKMPFGTGSYIAMAYPTDFNFGM